MGQISSCMAPNEQRIIRQTAERQPSQDKITSSISPTTGPNERLGNTFHCGVLL